MKAEIAKSISIVAAEYEISMDDARTEIWMTALEPYGAMIVARAVTLLIHDPQTGKYGKPRINDLLAKCELVQGGDKRPTADEAWALCLLGADEANTVVWTEECAKAFHIASPVLDRGDEIGARMAFRQAYERLVRDARSQGQGCKWLVSLGCDPEGREVAIRQGVTSGFLTENEGASHLPMLETEKRLALEWNKPTLNPKEQIAKIRNLLNSMESQTDKLARIAMETAEVEREHTRHRKEAIGVMANFGRQA
jgi:hypothetical protein